MKVLVVLFVDIKIEGVEAVLAIPDGATPTETRGIFDQWIARQAKSQKLKIADFEDSYMFEAMDVLTLPTKVRKSRKAK